MNRLAGETSPYLLQHADNSVEWFPWGPEALSRARAEASLAMPTVEAVAALPARPSDCRA